MTTANQLDLEDGNKQEHELERSTSSTELTALYPDQLPRTVMHKKADMFASQFEIDESRFAEWKHWFKTQLFSLKNSLSSLGADCLTPSLPADVPPLRSELFSAEKMEQHGKVLAAEHSLSRFGLRNHLLNRLDDNAEVLIASCNLLTVAVKAKSRIVPAGEWLLDNFYFLADSSQTIEQMVLSENQQQAADQVTISNTIGSLRILDACDWRIFVESMSIVERILREDIDGIYGNMNFATRDRYRQVIDRLAKRIRLSEADVARAALALAANPVHKPLATTNISVSPANSHKAHVGYYLVDEGLPQLENAINARVSLMTRCRRKLGCLPLTLLLTSIILLTAIFASLIIFQVQLNQINGWRLWLFGFFAVLAASQLGSALTQWFAVLQVSPTLLPRMNYEQGLPPEMRTLVVIPTMLSNSKTIECLLEALEVRFLGNQDEHLHFGLLTDFSDAKTEHVVEDEALLKQAKKGIEALNHKYHHLANDRFYLFHRARLWNSAERCWMGYERKRGKLADLNALLSGEEKTHYFVDGVELIRDRFAVVVGNIYALTSVKCLTPVKYVITLDTDTELPRDAARECVACMAHPLNIPRYNKAGTRVVAGYGILQPRMAASLLGANRSRYAQLNGNEPGIDPYTRSVSDVYQDVFGEGSFIGKGIYEIEAFEKTIKGNFPNDRILSHDLLEGCYARSGLLSDVQLYEEYPARYACDVSRRERWIRGDWQIASWVLPWVPGPSGKSVRNPLSPLSRWKIFDNLLRSLVPMAMLMMLLLGWILTTNPLAWTAAVVGLIFTPSLLMALFDVCVKPNEILLAQHLAGVLRSVLRSATQAVFRIACLPHEAFYSVDAIVRSTVRVLLSRRKLLQWNPHAQTIGQVKIGIVRSYHTMLSAPLMAVVGLTSVLLLYQFGLKSLNSLTIIGVAPVLLLWFFAPLMTWWMSQPLVEKSVQLSRSQLLFLHKIARKTWAYFDQFVTAEDHWLPPDNVQEAAGPTIAHRTSPTNMGLTLLANLAAYDFAFIPAGTLLARTANTLDSMLLLERHQGHFYNWYDTQTLQPLPPRYISVVDSGNLAGHLLTLRAGLLLLSEQPIVDVRVFEGFESTLAIVNDELALMSVTTNTDAFSKLKISVVNLQTIINKAVQARPKNIIGFFGFLEKISIAANALKTDSLPLVTSTPSPTATPASTSTPSSTSSVMLWIEFLLRQIDDAVADIVFFAPALTEPRPASETSHDDQCVAIDIVSPCDIFSHGEIPSLKQFAKFCQTSAELDWYSHQITESSKVRNSLETAELTHRGEMFNLGCQRAIQRLAHIQTLVTYVTGAADSRAVSMAMVEKYQDRHLADRVFDLAYTHSSVTLRQINTSEADAALYRRFARSVIYANSNLRADANLLIQNRRGQSGLWGYAISGDLPIVLLKIASSDNIELARQMIQCHAYWRIKGLAVDLVIWNEDHVGYRQRLQDQITGLISTGSEAQTSERPGGIFVRSAEQISIEDKILLQSVARAIIVDSRGTLQEQLNRRLLPARKISRLISSSPLTASSRLAPSSRLAINKGIGIPSIINSLPILNKLNPLAKANIHAQSKPTFAKELGNGLGRFSDDGREYIITIGAGNTTPLPWVNVLANPHFGSVISESGLAYTWSENAHEFRLTPWSDDPVGATSGEAIYVRDEDTGEYWSPTPLPTSESTHYSQPASTHDPALTQDYVTRHGFGYSVFVHTRNGIETELWVYVDLEESVKYSVLKMRNKSGTTRRLSATGYVEWVLGDLRSKSAMHVVTDIDANSGALFARNSYNTEFTGRVAFFDVDDPERTLTGDRAEFLGRNNSIANPDALTRIRLSGKLGAALDPCGAIQVPFELAEGQMREIIFRLGAGKDIEQTRALSQKLRVIGTARMALEKVQNYWRHTLSAVQIKTPDTQLNVLANGWLLYQTLACRIWARSGFYQSGGAYGFRDQLQDSMALVHAAPQLMREHLLRSAQRQYPEGDVQHWWHPPIGRGVRTRCSDDFLWLPLVTSRYVQSTGDTGVLNENVHFIEGRDLAHDEESYYDLPSNAAESASLYQHCVRAIEHGLRFGEHGLPLMGSGDWNDGMNLVGIEGKGESVWLGFFLFEVLNQFSKLAQLQNDLAFAQRCLSEAEKLKQNLELNAWDGAWYRRAYFDDGTPLGSNENKECSIDSISQSWSVLSGAGSSERTHLAMDSLDRHLVRRDQGIIQLLDPPFDTTAMNPGYIKGYVPGVRENGGQYTHAAVWAAMAFAKLGDRQRAWELLDIINPLNHTRTAEEMNIYKAEPYVITADVYAIPPHTGRGGWSWYTGSAGLYYRLIIESLLGIYREGNQLRITPCFNLDWQSYSIDYRFADTDYHLEVIKIAEGINTITLDGNELHEALIPLMNDRIRHKVIVRIGGQ